LTAVLVVLIATHHLTYFDLLIFAVLFGTFDALFMPCITALTPEIVPEDLLPAMNAVRPLSNNLMGNMIGPAVGGVIAAASTSWAIGVDCATFLVSAGALFLMKPTPTPKRTPGSSMLSEIKEACGSFARRVAPHQLGGRRSHQRHHVQSLGGVDSVPAAPHFARQQGDRGLHLRGHGFLGRDRRAHRVEHEMPRRRIAS